MFEKLEEKLQDYKKSHPGATVNHQLQEGDETPLIIAIVSPLMKRVHKEIPQCEELVFIDSTSNTEEHSLKAFMMCTQSVAGALQCGILITSDEKESTLKQRESTEYCLAIIYYVIVHFPHITATVEVPSR